MSTGADIIIFLSREYIQSYQVNLFERNKRQYVAGNVLCSWDCPVGKRGELGRVIVLGYNFQCPGVLLTWIIVGQGSTALAVGVCWGRKGDVVTDVFFFSRLSCVSSL